MNVILASESPHKRAVLSRAGVEFDAVKPDYEEDMSLELKPEALALALALGKARAVAKMQPDAVVIGTDVFVVFGKKPVGKPKDAAEAKRILRSYRGKDVAVVCGLAAVQGAKALTHVETASVRVRDDLSDAEIDAYVATGEPMRSSGAFTHDELGASIMESHSGDHSSIIGLPIYATLKFLRAFGVNPLCRR